MKLNIEKFNFKCFSEDVLGISVIKTNKLKARNNLKETEKELEDNNQVLNEHSDGCPVTKRPSVWYFQEISPEKRKTKIPNRQVATQTDVNNSSEVEMRLTNLENSMSSVIHEIG